MLETYLASAKAGDAELRPNADDAQLESEAGPASGVPHQRPVEEAGSEDSPPGAGGPDLSTPSGDATSLLTKTLPQRARFGRLRLQNPPPQVREIRLP